MPIKLELCRSGFGDGGWSLHLPDNSLVTSGSATATPDGWDRPNDADWDAAREAAATLIAKPIPAYRLRLDAADRLMAHNGDGDCLETDHGDKVRSYWVSGQRWNSVTYRCEDGVWRRAYEQEERDGQ